MEQIGDWISIFVESLELDGSRYKPRLNIALPPLASTSFPQNGFIYSIFYLTYSPNSNRMAGLRMGQVFYLILHMNTGLLANPFGKCTPEYFTQIQQSATGATENIKRCIRWGKVKSIFFYFTFISLKWRKEERGWDEVYRRLLDHDNSI